MEDKRTIMKRLDILENAMITNYLSELEFDSDEDRTSLYDSLLYKTIVEGTFDDIFLSEHLDGLDNDEKQRIMSLARKYNSLCLYDGNFDYWQYSVDGVTSGPSMIVALILSNYNYLIKLAKDGGEDVLRFLNKFQGSGIFDDDAVITRLRNSFYDDSVLEDVLINMSKEDGIYKDFTDSQKLVLCNHPNGILYKDKEDEPFEMVDVKKLKMRIQKIFIGSYDFEIEEIDLSSFEDIISRIYMEFNKDNYNVYKK